MKRAELMSRARRHIWDAWQGSSEELASQAVAVLEGLGMLVEPGGAIELERLRLLTDAQPVALTQPQAEALERAALGGGLAALLGLWESMRSRSGAAAEQEALRARLLELLPRDACMTRGTPNALAAAQGEYGAWELVAEVLGVALPYRPAEPPIPYALTEQAARVARQSRIEAIADVGDWLDEVGEKNAAHLVYTCDIPAARDMKPVAATPDDREDHFVSPLHRDYTTPHDPPRPAGACDVCGDGPDRWCPDCGACRRGCHGGDTSGCAHLNAPWAVTP
jgi:hypothetical protein